MLYPCVQCYAIIPHHIMPYVPQVRWIICSFSSLSLPPGLRSIQSQLTVHLLFQHQNTRSLHFIPIWRWISFPLHFFLLPRLSAMLRLVCFFLNIIFIHITCLRMYSNMKQKKLYRARERKREKERKNDETA